MQALPGWTDGSGAEWPGTTTAASTEATNIWGTSLGSEKRPIGISENVCISLLWERRNKVISIHLLFSVRMCVYGCWLRGEPLIMLT